MKLPNFGQILIREEKLSKYLLSTTHPDGASKARFFIKRGFSVENPDELKTALIEHLINGEVVEEIPNQFGTKYVLKGLLKCPDGTNARIRSIWIVENEKDILELVTAYPL